VSSAASDRAAFSSSGAADQEPVVKHAVGHVHEHAEVSVGRQFPGVPAALEQGVQRGPPDGGEVREHPRDMLVVLRFRDDLPEPVGIIPVFQARKAVDDVADAIVYLAGAGFVTGTVLECTGGSNLTAAALAG
jgi:hypothetical protein